MYRDRGQPNWTGELLAASGDRLAHVHVHDNLGGDDLHLPLSVGTIDWSEIAATLKRAGWDGAVTLEIVAAERARLRRRAASGWTAGERRVAPATFAPASASSARSGPRRPPA